MKDNKNKDLIERYAYAEYPESEDMRDYIRKRTFKVIELSDGSLFRLDKGYIEKDFCFGHGFCGISTAEEEERAWSMRDYASKSYDYFLQENTREISDHLSMLEHGHKKDSVYNRVECYLLRDGFRSYISFRRSCDRLPEVLPCKILDGEDRSAIISLYRELLANKGKRCSTWWKKYGPDYIHAWTYLVD